MKGSLAVAGVVVGLLLPGPGSVQSSVCDDREAGPAIEQARRREADGKTNDAVLLYRHALQSCPTSAAARTELQRLGRAGAARAERQGNLYSPGDLVRVVPDEACRKYLDQVGEGMKAESAFERLAGTCDRGGRLVVNEGASAFAWLEGTANHAEADRVMATLARSRPDDPTTFATVNRHFEGRRRAGGALAPAPERLRELEAIAVANVDRHLAAEDRHGPALMRPMPGGDSPTEQSLAELKRARDWARFAPGAAARLAARVEQRGDTLAQGDTPRLLRGAVEYYRLVPHEAKLKQTRAKAERLGEAAAGRGEHAVAAEFFTLAGNSARAAEMNLLTRQPETRTRKDDAARKKFREEQDALEKELNLKK